MNRIKKISILGAGWLGMPLGERLVNAGYTINGSTTSPEKISSIAQKGMHPFLIEIDQAIKGQKLDQFFDCDLLFINIPPSRKDPAILESYPLQIQLLIERIRKHQIPYCLFISSTSVYGDQNKVVKEDSPSLPSKDSGKALILCEQQLLNIPGCQTTILRMAGLAGGNRKVGRFLAGKKDLSNGQGKVNLVHLEDCIGVIQAIIKQEQWKEVFNVCADLHPTRQELYTAQAKKLGLEPPSFLPNEPAKYKVVSNDKVKRILDYVFQWPDPMDF